MQLGQVPDLGFDPGPYDGGGGSVYGDPSLTGRPVAQRVDPTTALLLADAMGPAAVADVQIYGGSVAVPVQETPEDDGIPTVALGVGMVLLVGTLWYFNR